MTLSSSRRNFIRTVLGGAAGLSLAEVVRAQEPARAATAATPPAANGPFAATRLSDRLLLITGAGANVVVLAQPEGLLLVNGGAAEHAAGLTAFLQARFPGQAARVLVNTDWHPEHTGLNETLGAAGAKIAAHENTRLWLGAEIHCQWRRRTYKPLPPRALPNDTFDTTAEMTFGQQPVVCGALGQAHTDGDVYVYFPGPNILVAGDVVTVGRYPVLDYTTGGWIGGMAAATRTLLGVANAETRIVPGEGPVQTRADLQAEHDMLAAVRDRLVKLMKSGLGAEEIIAAAPTSDFDAKWGSPEQFMKNVYPGLWGHVRELGGVI